MKAVSSLSILSLLGALGCQSTPLERSCDGEPVDTCGPYEYAVVRSAAVEPPGVEVGDPGTAVRVRVEYDACDRAPGTHRVAMLGRATATGLPDSGSSLMVYNLEELRDDGATHGDPEAGDGVIEAELLNPFFELPPDRDVRLVFEPRLASCRGEPLELDYRTGPRWTPADP